MIAVLFFSSLSWKKMWKFKIFIILCAMTESWESTESAIHNLHGLN